jgi:hypothetical protein
MNLARALQFNLAFGPAPGVTGGGYEETMLFQGLQEARETIVWCPTMRVRHYVEPRRMSQEYVEGYMAQKGFEIARMRAEREKHMWLGVPRWLWKQYAKASAIRVASDVAGYAPPFPTVLRSGDCPSTDTMRLRRLTWRREQKYLGGLLRGYRARFTAAAARADNEMTANAHGS